MDVESHFDLGNVSIDHDGILKAVFSQSCDKNNNMITVWILLMASFYFI